MARIRTLTFLPEIFQTSTNSQFLSATLDQIVNDPQTLRLDGFIGNRFGPGSRNSDLYINEPNKIRSDYQLEPGVVFTNTDEKTARDFISYPEMISTLSVAGANVSNHDRMFESETYSWDSFVDLDKLVNYHEYYWLQDGPPAVTISPNTIFTNIDFNVFSLPNSYEIRAVGTDVDTGANPVISLLRGGTYTFNVNQNTQFWIQTEPGISGVSRTQSFTSTREVFGVDNNGATQGTVTFNVPFADSQDDLIFDDTLTIDLIADLPFDQINGKLLNNVFDVSQSINFIGVNDIDGITGIEGLRIAFANGLPQEIGYVSSYFDEMFYDINDDSLTNPKTIVANQTTMNSIILAPGNTTQDMVINQTITIITDTLGGLTQGQVYFVKEILSSNEFTISLSLGGDLVTIIPQTSGTMTININQGQYDQGFDTEVNNNFYRVQLIGDPANPIIRLLPDGEIPERTNIVPRFGNKYINRQFFKSQLGFLTLIPPITAPLSTLYYVDGSEPNRVGIIKLVEANERNFIDVEEEILGKVNYTSPNGVSLTNGLKIRFDGNIFPLSFRNGQYYVENVGKGIQLLNTNNFTTPEPFTVGEFSPFDTVGYDLDSFDINLNLAIEQDYITIARNSISRDAWARSNRWFHGDVIRDTAEYNNNSQILNDLITLNNKAKRPIIEFYPNLKLFNSGVEGKDLIDFYDTKSTDGLSEIPGLINYYPDTEVYTKNTAIVASSSNNTTTITVDKNDIFGTFEIGMFVGDTQNLLPFDAQVIDIEEAGDDLVLTVIYSSTSSIAGGTTAVSGSDTQITSSNLFPGARIVFANDSDAETRNQIYVVDRASSFGNANRFVLSKASDGLVSPDQQVTVKRGFRNQGKTFYFNGSKWIQAQQKITVNQPPLFDVFDRNNTSFSDETIYNGTSFKGTKLFSFGISSFGADDPILGFPLRFSDINNIGDISFDVSLNTDTFDYTIGTGTFTEKLSTGYVHQYSSLNEFQRKIGWEKSADRSAQYLQFNFNFNGNSTFTCDVAPISQDAIKWPIVKVFVNSQYQTEENYVVTTTANSTSVTLPSNLEEGTIVQIFVLSKQQSKTAFYSIPNNLSNNPLNNDLTVVDLGDIRNHYRDLFINAPALEGNIFGINNSRDSGDLTTFGTKIIKNSSPLTLAGLFLRQGNMNIFDALTFSSREYVKSKQLLVNLANTSNFFDEPTNQVLDNLLEEIAANKSEINSFFWSDMVPSKTIFSQNIYTFNSDLDITNYPLHKVYDFTKASYEGVLVYIRRNVNGRIREIQLLNNVDYTISSESPSLTVTRALMPGDNVIVKEYNQTFGSYVPYTPTKLGLYPLFIPDVILDVNYLTPTYFIRGHDGSYTKLYGNYDPDSGDLEDLRDRVLLEFEKRIYNNIKLKGQVFSLCDMLPGFFRETDYSYDEWLQIYSENFLDWVGQNRIEFKRQQFQADNEFSFNYSNSTNKLNRATITQGNWRGLYQHFYDTTTPNATPWEMVGFASKPSWWESRYGPAPYTSENEILWQDLEEGKIYDEEGNFTVNEKLSRPGLSDIIPVDESGNLLNPLETVIGNYNSLSFQRNWKVGDLGPAELSYRRSSSYPFDLIKMMALLKPAKFYSLGVDVDDYFFDKEFNQYLVNNRTHLKIDEIKIYGEGTPKTSYLNWIVDYTKQFGVAATSTLEELLDNVDVRLIYRLAGFSDKTMLNFFAEKSSPASGNSSLLIPDESYSLLVHDNQANDRLVYSSVIVQKNSTGGFVVFGNSQSKAYFKVYAPIQDNDVRTITVVNQTVRIANNYVRQEVLVPYGTVFNNAQELSQFLMNYSEYLTDRGVKYESVENGNEVNWTLMIKQFLYWTQLGWDVGSIITLNPLAAEMLVDKDNSIVQPLTLSQQNFILNQDLYPIQTNSLCINRDGTRFKAHTLNDGDAMSFAAFNLNNIEHGVVFDNTTLFNDVIYNLTTGLKQNRMILKGTKTAAWNGTVNSFGFILSQDNVKEWRNDARYPKGTIVRYKNDLYSASQLIQPSSEFDKTIWSLMGRNTLQTGLLPNNATRAFESTLYYNTNINNLDKDADLLSYSLIGYRPRDYMSLADLSSITEINVFKNMIESKGTLNSVKEFDNVKLIQGDINYEVYENWAIKTSEYGGRENDNYVEFNIDNELLTSNPSIVSLTNGVIVPGAQQSVPISSLLNYKLPISDPNILDTVERNKVSVYPYAGYANFNDVKMSSYFYSGLPKAVNKENITVPITDFYVGDYFWLANFKEKWGIFTWKSVGRVIEVTPNVDNTATLTFDSPHTLKALDPVAVLNFANNVDGYYIVSRVVNLTQVVVNLNLTVNNNRVLSGNGICMLITNQRVASPSDIAKTDLLEFEFIKNTVWIDDDKDGNWAVYRKTNNYKNLTVQSEENTSSYGSSVAYSGQAGYLVSDPASGTLYRYAFNTIDKQYQLSQTFVESASFGSDIARVDNTFAVSQPEYGPKIELYTWNQTIATDDIIPYQTITDTDIGFGTNVKFSHDSNWLFVSNPAQTKVKVYRKANVEITAEFIEAGRTYIIDEANNTDFLSIGADENRAGIVFKSTGTTSGNGKVTDVTYELVSEIDGTTLGFDNTDGYGKSVTTDRLGEVVVITAPNFDFDPTDITDWGKTVLYQRATQTFEVQSNSNPDAATELRLGWTVPSISAEVQSTNATGNIVTLDDATGLVPGQTIVFRISLASSAQSPLLDTGISPNKTYYIASVAGNNITLKLSRNTNDIVSLITKTLISNTRAVAQTERLLVTVNGKLVQDNNYATDGNIFIYTTDINAGDIVRVDGNEFYELQTFNSNSSERPNQQFGASTDINENGNELLVGSPFEIDNENREGQVYRYTNAGSRFGLVVGKNECNVTTNREIYINGYRVLLQEGDAERNSDIINSFGITNIQASYTVDNKLVIQVIDKNLAQANRKLVITAFDKDALIEAGIEIFSQTQVITAPHNTGPTQFGNSIKINKNSVVIAAPTSSKVLGTKFDFSDDANLDNDTLFDNNATRFRESIRNYGAVYMYDLLDDNSGGLNRPGKFIYSQPVNNTTTNFVLSPRYGDGLEFNDGVVIVGAPNERLDSATRGTVTFFENSSKETNWTAFRKPSFTVDIEKVQNSQLFSSVTNETLTNLDYIDPLQGKILGAARENLDFISSADPAKYNNNPSPNVWGEEAVGKLWLDTSNIRFVDYHQDDIVYNSENWGRVFPGSDVAVYTWVRSNTPPSQYRGSGKVYDVNKFAVSNTLDSSNIITPVYYYWVRDTGVINRNTEKTLADKIVARYIQNPERSGISYFAPLLPNTFAIYNSESSVNAAGAALHIGYASSDTLDAIHNEFALIRANNSQDFLTGLPASRNRPSTLPNRVVLPGPSDVEQPTGLYQKLLDSLAGTTTNGQLIPDPFLPRLFRTGVLSRPRQSFFLNRRTALQNYISYANEILKEVPIAELKPDLSFLFASNEFYDTTDYWEFVNWWAKGFDESTRASFQVERFADLFSLTVAPETLVKVEKNGQGFFEIYRLERTGAWTRIGLEKGTIKFSDKLWKYLDNGIGFSADFFDVQPFDTNPSEETRNIIRALNEQIFTDELLIHRNKSLTLLFDYIVSEASETQNYLTWLNKTSLVEVEQRVRELLPFEIFRSDNAEFLEGFVNEVKPYHVTIKEFLLSYDGKENFVGDISDFDLPAKFNPNTGRFVTPNLVVGNANNITDFNNENPIWKDLDYKNWFENSGLSLTGIENYQIASLRSFVGISDRTLKVDNAAGFPSTGIIRINDEEMSYSTVNKDTNEIGGLSRGLNNTSIAEHIPGALITTNLPPIIVLDEGSGYSSIPRVTAVVDTDKYPEPREEAVLQAVLSGNRVTDIRVISPGSGYFATPEIVVEPAYEIVFSNIDINTTLNTISVFAPLLSTGNIVRFKQGSNGGRPSKLVDDNWYYVGVLENLPSVVIALYNSVSDAVKDENRIVLNTTIQSNDMKLLPGCRASVLTKAEPVRENNIKIRLDRTTYNTQVKDWEAQSFYGGFFAGEYYNSERISSSAITLSNTVPDIATILASAAGIAFEIQEVNEEVILTWSSFPRVVSGTNTDNTIELVPQDGNDQSAPDYTPLSTSSGTTVGFYKNMPIKFSGAGPNEIIENETYYVSEIIDETRFTISASIDGPEVTLSNFVTSAQGYRCFTGENNSTTILTIRYPGIHQVTRTEQDTNRLTIPVSPVGTGGTDRFYTNLPVFFTENAFGNVVENTVYFVTTVIDNQTFTMSETPDPIMTEVTDTDSFDNSVIIVSTDGFTRNDPIIFTEVFGLDPVIIPGKTYYVGQVLSSNRITITEFINGPVIILGDTTGNAKVTNQKDTVKLTNATGSMTMNVELPVSPGQVDGQLFTFYDGLPTFTGVESENFSDLIIRNNIITIGTQFGEEINRVLFPIRTETTANFYINMPVTVSVDIGNLEAGDIYYVTEFSGRIIDPSDPFSIKVQRTIVEVLTTEAIGNKMIATYDPANGLFGTAVLYEGMPLRFSGAGIGNIDIVNEYFVKEIISLTEFTISLSSDGTEVVLSDALGSLIGMGDPFVTLSATKGGATFALSNSGTTTTQLQQVILETPEFNVSSLVGGYTAQIVDGGEGFAVNNIITISGLQVGGTAPENNLTLVVDSVDENGAITAVIRRGTPTGTIKQYYLKVRSPNTVEVYKNSIQTVPVSLEDFNYKGYTLSTVSGVLGDNQTLTVDTTEFNEFDAVVFTGNVPGEIIAGKIYYLYEKTNTRTKITTSPNDPTTTVNNINFVSEFTMAKIGGITLLPEPFFFTQSIVRFNNRLYVCAVSNNDTEFVIGKWDLLDAADRRLNAMDRVEGYYQPTANMPSTKLSQLFEGVTYPNPIYRANDFEPDKQLELDTILTTEPFAEVDIDFFGVTYNNGYQILTRLEQGIGIFRSDDLENWTLTRLTNADIPVTSITTVNEMFAITSTNTVTPIFKSSGGLTWTSTGYNIPNFGDVQAIDIGSVELNKVVYFEAGDIYVAVGNTIVSSTDLHIWREQVQFDNILEFVLNDVVATNNFVIAVGKGKKIIMSNNVQVLVDTALVFYSEDGNSWQQVENITEKGFNAVAFDGNKVVAIGEDGIIYTTFNGLDWFGVNEVNVVFTNADTNELSVQNSLGFEQNSEVRFNNSFSTIVANTSYYINSVLNDTQVFLSDTLGGPVKTLTISSIPSGTKMSLIDTNLTDINSLVFANGTWIASGIDGTILRSPNGNVWDYISIPGLEANLASVSYNDNDNIFVIVGENNTILFSEDDGISWEETSIINSRESTYTIKGTDFTFGYAPEELVAGVVKDRIAILPTTRPGINWPVVEYGFSGFNSKSIEIAPAFGTQTRFSFANVVEVPAAIIVQAINGQTGLATTIYQDINYTIDWPTKTVVLNEPLNQLPVQDTLLINVFEVGNGYQIVKSSTDLSPIRNNDFSGFNEIFLDCAYSGQLFEGTGAIRPGTTSFSVRVFATESLAGRIFCEDVSQFRIDSPVTFQGIPFGGLQENTVYYVSSISTATNSITVSDIFDPIINRAGPVITLTDATGQMFANIDGGSGELWSPAFVTHNGTRLITGTTGLVTETISADNSIVSSTTMQLFAGTPITFCQCEFGTIEPFKRYFIKNILDNRRFTISETLNGPELEMVNFNGVANYVTNDFAILRREFNKSSLVFAKNDYNTDNDYIVFSIFGEEQTVQREYSIPETQTFIGDGLNSKFILSNFIGLMNPNNAIVELNGVRLTRALYNFSLLDNSILLSAPPLDGDILAITTFNDTNTQYLNTQFNVTGNPGSSLQNLVVVETVQRTTSFDQDDPVLHTFDQNDPEQSLSPIEVTYDEFLNYVILGAGTTTDELNVNDTIIFSNSIGGIAAGQTYFIRDIVDSTIFTISEEVGGPAFIVFNDTGNVSSLANGLTVSSIINVDSNIEPPLAITNATESTNGAPNSITVLDVTGFVIGQPVQFFGDSFDTNLLTNGTVYFIETIDSSTSSFTVRNFFGDTIVTAGGNGFMQVVVGGRPTVRITTEAEHLFVENTLVRIDGVSGSVELNNSLYYAKIIDPFTFDIYNEPYQTALGSTNSTVTVITAYEGSGYTWRQGLFFVSSNVATQTTTSGQIFLNRVDNLVSGTPVFFSNLETSNNEILLGGIVQGKEYYILDIDTDSNFIRVTEERNGSVVLFNNETGRINLIQWNHKDKDRIYVTINGNRVPPSHIRLNEVNELSIMAKIAPGDQIIITSMIPTALPDQLSYINLIDNDGNAEVFRINTARTTWLEDELTITDNSIVVDNVNKLVNSTTTTIFAPAIINGTYNIGLSADRNTIVSITVTNLTTGNTISPDDFELVIVDLTPTVKISGNTAISDGDQLEIIVLEGSPIYVNGEIIRFTEVDFENNRLSGLARGTAGTSAQTIITKYSVVYSLIAENRLSDFDYNRVWNSNNINEILGDPLQLSDTFAANFLNNKI